MIADWEKEIAIACLVQSEIDSLDVDRIWQYHLPKVKASEQLLIETESILSKQLDPEYRRFLKFANGWRCVHGHRYLFGTEVLTGVVEMQKAKCLLDQLAPQVLEHSCLDRSNLFPIAVDEFDVDVFAIHPSKAAESGEVVWFAHEEVERYATFDHFFLAMVEYNKRRREKFRRGEMRLSPRPRGE